MTATVAFVDEVAVERAMLGDQVRVTRLERWHAVAAMTARGMSAEQIANRLGLSARQVVRIRVEDPERLARPADRERFCRTGVTRSAPIPTSNRWRP